MRFTTFGSALLAFVPMALQLFATPGMAELAFPGSFVLVDVDERRDMAVFRRHDGQQFVLRAGELDDESRLRLVMVGVSAALLEVVPSESDSDMPSWHIRMEREADGGRVTRTSDRLPEARLHPVESWRIDGLGGASSQSAEDHR